jgi:hypothetical protein
LVVAVLVVAVLVAAVLVVAAVTVFALAAAVFAAADRAALAGVPVAPLAALALAPREERGAAAGTAAVVRGVRERCAVPWRCVGTFFGAFSSAAPAFARAVPRAEARVDRVPVTGSVPSSRRRSWWSELMHLTSVGGHCRGAPGERSGSHVNTA